MTTILQRTSRRISAALAVAVLTIATAAHADIAAIRDLSTLPDTPIQDVVLGEPAFSPATTGYVDKQLADLDSVPFAPSVDSILLTTEEAEADDNFSVIWRKPVDDGAARRRPLTVYNYSNIALRRDGKSIIVFAIPSRGLMYQFALVLKFYYKQQLHKDVAIAIRFDPRHEDAAVNNYARLNAFFTSALTGQWAQAKGGTFTLVFGYKKVVDTQFGEALGPAITANGWVGTIYKPTKKTDLATDFVVTLDSDKQSSWHVEVLAENIRALVANQATIGIKVAHVVLAGSAGYIGNDGNGAPAITPTGANAPVATPEKYAFVYPDLLLDERTVVVNPLGHLLGAPGYLHTSVPSVLSETNAAMATLRAAKITSVDMEFAYVADALKDSGILVSVACLITDYPWAAPAGVRLAEKSDEDKARSEIIFAQGVARVLGIK